MSKGRSFGDGKESLKSAIMKGDIIILTGPLGSGKTTILKEVVADVGSHHVITVDIKVMGPSGQERLLETVKVPAFEGPRLLWHFPNIDKVDKRFLTKLAKTAARTKAVTIVFETTLRKDKIGELKSYCRVISISKPSWQLLKKVAKEHGHSFQPQNLHQAVAGAEGIIDKGDFERITRFFDGTSVVKIEGTFIFWVLHNSREMLGANDKFLLRHYLSALARCGRLELGGNFKFKGVGRPSFPYYLRKKSMKRVANK